MSTLTPRGFLVARLRGTLAAILFLFAFLFAGTHAAQAVQATGPAVAGVVRAQHLNVELLPLSDSIQPGGSTEVGLHFTLDKGWHVYWINAGDSGEPPAIHWSLPAGITADAMQFPAPQRLALGPLMDFGYENEVLFPLALHASAGVHPSSGAPLAAHVTWLVCREMCIPGKADLLLPLRIGSPPHAVNPATLALFQKFGSRLPQPLPASYRAVFAQNPHGFTLAVTGRSAPSAEFFPLDQTQINNPSPQPVEPIADGLKLSLVKDQNLQAAPARLNGVLLFPDGTAYEVHALPGAVPATIATSVAGSAGAALLFETGALAFLGGMILNLMPCVFPVLFIKALSLVQSSKEERRRLRVHGLVYTLGILVSFWAMVAVLLVLRLGGSHLGWGFQFQNPTFLALMALLMFFLGLSLAGMFEIGLTVTSVGSGLASRHGYGGSFFTGVLAMVVATPCTAPFMGPAVGFALSRSAGVSFLIFTAIGLGLAAPYLLLAFQPAWTRLLPRPGAWMEILKQATAVPIFATAIWLVWLFTQSAGVNALMALLAAFLLLAIAGWILGRWPARRVASAFAVLFMAAAVAAPIYALHEFAGAVPDASPLNGSAAANQPPPVWQPFSPAALEQYRAQGRPVFVDFTASWCLSCQVNERVVLDRPDVERRLRNSGIVLVRADWTRHNADIGSALDKLGRSGVPTYVLYSPSGAPRILPEVLTPGIVFDALDWLKAGAAPDKQALLQAPGESIHNE